MSSPSETSVQNQISALTRLLNEVRRFGNVNTKNVDDMVNSLTTILETEYAPEVTAATDAIRIAVSGAMSQATASSMFLPLLRAYAKNLGFPETSAQDILDRLRRDFAERGTPETVKTRGFTFGAATGVGSPTGDGVIHRVTLDRYGHPIESATPEVKTFRVLQDVNSGVSKHQESFAIRGDLSPRDLVDAFVGEDRQVDDGLVGVTAADSNQIGFRNCSFESILDIASTDLVTALPGWRIGTAVANLETVSGDLVLGTGLNDFYREIPAEGDTPRSLRFKVNDTITQRLGRDVAVDFDPDVPYIVQIAFKRESSATGTITLTLGGKSVAVAIESVADGVWGELFIPITASDQWFETFNADPLDLKIAVATLAAGTVLVDDVIVSPMRRWDGTYWAAIGGRTAWVVGDELTATDTVTSEDNDAINQLWLIRAHGYDGYLPSDAVPTWLDPT